MKRRNFKKKPVFGFEAMAAAIFGAEEASSEGVVTFLAGLVLANGGRTLIFVVASFTGRPAVLSEDVSLGNTVRDDTSTGIPCHFWGECHFCEEVCQIGWAAFYKVELILYTIFDAKKKKTKSNTGSLSQQHWQPFPAILVAFQIFGIFHIIREYCMTQHHSLSFSTP